MSERAEMRRRVVFARSDVLAERIRYVHASTDRDGVSEWARTSGGWCAASVERCTRAALGVCEIVTFFHFSVIWRQSRNNIHNIKPTLPRDTLSPGHLPASS